MRILSVLTNRKFILGALAALLAATAVVLLSCGVYYRRMSGIVTEKFAGKRWELPARVFARPLELFPGLEMTADEFEQELQIMQYRRLDKRPDTSGTYLREDTAFEVISRSFQFDDGTEPAKHTILLFKNGRISGIRNAETAAPLDMIRFDPAQVGSFYPTSNEDRILVKLSDVPDLLTETLIAVEDRDFYKHHGVSPAAILRAVMANIRKLDLVQGGSTLTQQLVKNFFLTREQTLKRKIEEIFMALALERNFEKNEILEGYLNEVYLGQDGSRAVHGFGLAALFYFNRPLRELRGQEIAMLVGLLKGPSHYDPRRFPQRALKRRNVVLQVLAKQNILPVDSVRALMKTDLGITQTQRPNASRFPAFMDMVKQQLLEEYREKDLRSEGLRIFTGFDPLTQHAVEKSVSERLEEIETRRNLPPGELETAVVVTDTGSNEITAAIGGRDPRFQGFNRAVNARRFIGSLVKPAVYLTALEDSDYYTLTSLVDDSEIRIEAPDAIPGPDADIKWYPRSDAGTVQPGENGLNNDQQDGFWIPRNYDRIYHGRVPLYQALVHSYNVATVRLGLGLGLDRVRDTLQRLGFKRDVHFYPASLLGTIAMAPLEVAQIYQTLASGGFYSPLRAIRSVHTPQGRKLERYALTVKQRIPPGPVYLLNKTLQAVVQEGTAQSLKHILPDPLYAAGKTGTTDDLRDSWFAGFTGNRLAVVWVGRDDNASSSLTGASGALQIWGDVMRRISNQPLQLPLPDTVEWVVIDPDTGMMTDPDCEYAVTVPYIKGSAPQEQVPCRTDDGQILDQIPDQIPGLDGKTGEDDKDTDEKPTFMNWLKGIFQ